MTCGQVQGALHSGRRGVPDGADGQLAVDANHLFNDSLWLLHGAVMVIVIVEKCTLYVGNSR